MRPRVIVYKSRGFLSAMSRPLLSDRFDRGTGMRKFFVGIVLAAMIAVSIFAFTACNDGAQSGNAYAASEGSWVVRTENPAEMAAEVTFTSDGLWRMFVNTGGLEEGQGQGANENNNWCNGHYYFEGEPGVSTLYMCLYDYDAYVEATGDTGTGVNNTYNPANVRMLDASNNRIEFNVYYQAAPDENGTYEFCIELLPMASFVGGIDPELARFRFDFQPPQDGTLGTDDAPQPVAPADGLTFIDKVIIIAVVVGVVIIAVIVAIVLIVKKKKKKKAAALAAGEDAETALPADDPDEGGGSAS